MPLKLISKTKVKVAISTLISGMANIYSLIGMCMKNTSQSDYNAISCTKDTSCPLNSVCDVTNKVCVNPQTITCGDDQHCGQASMCVSGICKPLHKYNQSCASHSDCGKKHVIDSAVCLVNSVPSK